jgi:hypothetical protein
MITFLIFDFGENEDAAQQARHRVDGWRQGFRLDKKLQLKFDRSEAETKSKKDKDGKPAVRLIVRVDFSEHEKLSHQRWVERIPADESFKTAKPKIIPSNTPEFKGIAEHFAELD